MIVVDNVPSTQQEAAHCTRHQHHEHSFMCKHSFFFMNIKLSGEKHTAAKLLAEVRDLAVDPMSVPDSRLNL